MRENRNAKIIVSLRSAFGNKEVMCAPCDDLVVEAVIASRVHANDPDISRSDGKAALSASVLLTENGSTTSRRIGAADKTAIAAA